LAIRTRGSAIPSPRGPSAPAARQQAHDHHARRQQSSTRRNAQVENAVRRSADKTWQRQWGLHHQAPARESAPGGLLQGSGTPSSEDASQKTSAPPPRANRIASPKFSPPKVLARLGPGRRPGFFLCEQLLADQNPIGSRWSLGQHLIRRRGTADVS